jgi:predicted ATPase
VASADNPVIFFLDDLQWADPASLEVVEALVTDTMSHHVMIICSYREGEMSPALLQQYHLAATKADDNVAPSIIESCVAQITDISVTGLDMMSLNELVASMLGMHEGDTQSLSTLVWNKTDGIPFYALSFVDMLRTTDLLSRHQDGSWIWDEYQILLQTNVADNSAAILVTKVQNLPEEVRSILQIASFIGHDFPTDALVKIVYEEQDMIQIEYSFERHSKEVIAARIIAALKLAVKEGLLETTPNCDDFKFSHDKIKQVLYEDLMPDDTERQLLHQRIGTLIWNSVKGTESSQLSDWPIFLAADNLNRALSVVDYSGSRYEWIELNVIAAKRATAKFAFIVAAEYLRVAVGLLEGDRSWDEHYDICIDLYSTAAKAEQSVSCYSRSKVLVNEIHKRAKTLQHQYVAYEIEVDSLLLQGDSKGSVLLGLDVLRKLGVQFPHKITTKTVSTELMRSKLALGRRPLSTLLELPQVTDERVILALKLMSTVAINGLILSDSFRDTFAAVALRMFYLTLRYGLSHLYSPMAVVLYGAFHVALGRIDIAVEAEQLAFAIIDTYRMESIRGSTMSISVGLIRFWRNKFELGVCDEMLRAYHSAMSFGHVIHAQYGYLNWLSAGTYLDESRAAVNTRTRCFVEEMRQYDVVSGLIFLLPRWQTVSFLGNPVSSFVVTFSHIKDLT